MGQSRPRAATGTGCGPDQTGGGRAKSLRLPGLETGAQARANFREIKRGDNRQGGGPAEICRNLHKREGA